MPEVTPQLVILVLGALGLSLLATPLPGRAVYSAATPLWLQTGALPALLGVGLQTIVYRWKGASWRQALLEFGATLAALAVWLPGQHWWPQAWWGSLVQLLYAALMVELRWRNPPRDRDRVPYLRMQRSLRLLHGVCAIAALAPWSPAAWPLWWSTHWAAAHQRFRVQAQLDEEFQQELAQLSGELASTQQQSQWLQQLTAAQQVEQWLAALGQSSRASARLLEAPQGGGLVQKARGSGQPQFHGCEFALPLQDGLVVSLGRSEKFNQQELRDLTWLVRRGWPALQGLLRQGSLRTLLVWSQQLAGHTHQEGLLRELPSLCSGLVPHRWGLLSTLQGQLLCSWGSLPPETRAWAGQIAHQQRPRLEAGWLGLPLGDWGVLMLGEEGLQPGHLHLLEIAGQQLSLAWQRARALAQLRQYQQQLILSSQMLTAGSLAAGVAHELNSPLGAISLMLDGASRYPDRAAEKLERAQQACQRAREIVDRMLRQALSPQELQPFRLDDCLREGLPFVEPHLRQLEVLLDARWSDNPTFNGRSSTVQQVLINLLTNAAQAYRHPPRKVELATHPWGFSVTDWGEGLSDEAAARIFEPFYSTRSDGYGLGLWICRDLLAQQGGQIRLLRPGCTRFEVLLQPISEASEKP
ncbi:MAG: HAMP domain-containing histidine kinase [Candidatus Eremiobacteraeota bacterium]|nr:HAMP domain-containing histidine kinase [Candidatus Eremiobacteraeota bacterium]MCW5867965.1 HAMP domain-containing histidine kinase [Candidatus Eremiobacteraeota bacterium]